MQDELKDRLLYEGYLNGDSGDWGLRNPEGPRAVSCIEALEAQVEGKERDAFAHGYLVAISTMLHQHNCPVTAEDAIRDAGFTLADAKRLGLDELDMKVLRPIFANIKRRDQYETARAALGGRE